MLVTVLILSGTILGATAIAGLLMLYQIRQTTNVADSAKAIFAADSGLECQFYRRFKDADSTDYCSSMVLNNEASFSTNLPDADTIQSLGESGQVARAFEATF